MLRSLGVFLGLLLLASCGRTVTPPPPGDLAGFKRPTTPNSALAAPAGFIPAPDTLTLRYPVSAEQLYAAVRGTILARPRTKEIAADPARYRADFVERSLVFRFPDVISVQVLPSAAESGLVVYSHSELGQYDFGVNKRRVSAILAALDRRLKR